MLVVLLIIVAGWSLVFASNKDIALISTIIGLIDYFIGPITVAGIVLLIVVAIFTGNLKLGLREKSNSISVKIRATIQAAVGIVMMVFGKLYLSSLGYIFGSWEMVLGPFGYFLTLFAVWAAINAFNMVDGTRWISVTANSSFLSKRQCCTGRTA